MKSNKNTTEFLDKLCKEQRKLNHLLTKDDEFTVKYLICRICKVAFWANGALEAP